MLLRQLEAIRPQQRDCSLPAGGLQFRLAARKNRYIVANQRAMLARRRQPRCRITEIGDQPLRVRRRRSSPACATISAERSLREAIEKEMTDDQIVVGLAPEIDRGRRLG